VKSCRKGPRVHWGKKRNLLVFDEKRKRHGFQQKKERDASIPLSTGKKKKGNGLTERKGRGRKRKSHPPEGNWKSIFATRARKKRERRQDRREKRLFPKRVRILRKEGEKGVVVATDGIENSQRSVRKGRKGKKAPLCCHKPQKKGKRSREIKGLRRKV